jgi:hypothetical protein
LGLQFLLALLRQLSQLLQLRLLRPMLQLRLSVLLHLQALSHR